MPPAVKSAAFTPRELRSQFHPVPASCRHHRTRSARMAGSSHTAQRIAFEAARRQLGDAAAADAAARDLAHAFGAVNPDRFWQLAATVFPGAPADDTIPTAGESSLKSIAKQRFVLKPCA